MAQLVNVRRLCIATAVTLVGLAAGCDDTGLHTGNPLLEVSPETLDFGALNAGERGELGLQLANVGTAALTVDSLALEGDAQFSLAALDGEPFETEMVPFGLSILGAGVSLRRLTLAFEPQERTDYAAELVIGSNADNAPELRVPLSGSGDVPDIEVVPGRLDFGGVRLNSSASLQLQIRNTGAAPLQVELADLELESDDEDPPFFWVGHDLELAQDEQGALEVVYAPAGEPELDEQGQVVPDAAALLIASNDPDEDPVRIELTGHVSDNLAPVTAVSIIAVTKLDDSPVEELCAPAPVDTITFEGRALDPEGSGIQGGNLRWEVARKPGGSTRTVQVPSVEQERFRPSFKPDLSGEYVVCLSASDPEGNRRQPDPDAACDCPTANAAEDFSCPCIRFDAFPREDIRIELTWDILGPDLDLHLVAPDGSYCSPTRECRYNVMDPDDPNWTRTACVDSGGITTCRTPNCDPQVAGCQEGQQCYDPDDGGPEPPLCTWGTCSGTDCYWNARRPDWGVPGDTRDDPLLAIDCTGQCRAENINLNHPVAGIYTVMVNYFGYRGNTTATVRIYFKGDIEPTAEFEAEMTEECDRWNVALIDWIDHDNHTVTSLGDSHSLDCCQ